MCDLCLLWFQFSSPAPIREGEGKEGVKSGTWFGVLMETLNGRILFLNHGIIALDSSRQNITGHWQVHTAANGICRAGISVNTLCLAIAYAGWNGVSQTFKSIFCNCDGVLLSVLGIAKLRVVVLSRAIEESCLEETWRNGLYAEPCSGELLWTDLSVGVPVCVERAICAMRAQSEQDACQRLCWSFWALHMLAARLQRFLHAETRGVGDGSQPVRMLNAPAAKSVWLPWTWALWSSDPESEFGWIL